MTPTPGFTYEGQLNAEGLRLAIVCARFNDFFVERLLAGALDRFVRLGGDAARVSVAWVPGAFETPIVARRFAVSGHYDAVVCLGVVIQGGTAHAGYVNANAAGGIASVSTDTGVPVIYGIVTTESIEQATERAGSKMGNRGADAVETAVEMANLLKLIDADLKD